MESLTKENFWNDLYAKYPEEVQKFCNWIDEYKKRVSWDQLFNDCQAAGLTYPDFTAPKYHDLPIAMQVGIFLQFMEENKITGTEVSVMEIVGAIEHYFMLAPKPK